MHVLGGLFASALVIHVAVLCASLADSSETVVVFRGNETVVPYTENDNKTVVDRKPLAYRVPAFVGGVFDGKELLVALCDARYNGWKDWDPIEMAARTSYGDHTKWRDAKIVGRNTRKSKKPVVGDPTAVMKGDKVYALVVSWDNSSTAWAWHKGDTGWNPLMYVGTVKRNADNADFDVQWAEPVSLKGLLPKMVGKEAGKQFVGGVGNGDVMSDGTIVLPIQIANVKPRLMASIIYSKDNGTTWEMGGFASSSLTEASVIEWTKGTLLMTTRTDERPRLMFQSNDMGKTWTEFTSLSGVWGNQLDRKGPGCQASLIKVSVEGTDVLLFSHPLNTLGGYKRDRLQLWMSNGHRVFHVGEISKQNEGERSGYAILAHVGEHLYCMHEINPFDPNHKEIPLVGWDRTIALNDISSMMETVKERVRDWKKLDETLSSAGVPTNGLIGHLSGSANNTVWADAYGCVDAVVQGAERVDGGFRFLGGSGSGARWPVRAQGQNQRYHSTRWAFTLAATLSINDITGNSENSVIGATADGRVETVLLGIGYTKDGKWFLTHRGADVPTDLGSFELNKEYRVALTYSLGIVSVFVDGVAVLSNKKIRYSRAEIKYFFMGGQASQTGATKCTVKNAMLYNRALNEGEVRPLPENFNTNTVSNSGAIPHKPEPAGNEAPQTPAVSDTSGAEPVSSGSDGASDVPPGGLQIREGADTEQQRDGACAAFMTAHLVVLLLAAAAATLL